MAELIKTSALLLHTIPWSDSSKICYFLTPDHGTIHIIARGALKQKSKFLGQCEPFILGEIIYSFKESRELQILQEITVKDRLPGINKDPDSFLKFSVLAEILLHTISENDEISLFFRHLQNVLLWTNNHPDLVNNVLINLLFAIPTQLGFRLNINKCKFCQKTSYGQSGYLMLETGEWICSECQKTSDSSTLYIPAEVITSISQCVPAKRLYNNLVKIEDKLFLVVLQIIETYLSTHLPKPLHLKSRDILLQMIR